MLQNRYVFEQTIAQEIVSPQLGEIIKKGDTIYKFVSIEHIPLDYDSDNVTINISTAEELATLADRVNSGDYSYVGNTYVLQNDIDLQGVIMPPIGTYRRLDAPFGNSEVVLSGFNATFDGAGHKITGYQRTAQTGDNGIGIFSAIGERGVVKNLTLENFDLSSVNAYKEYGMTGGTGALAGTVFMGGTIDNCHVNNSVITGMSMVGGLVGDVHPENYNDLTKTYSITNSSAYATVSASSYGGGFIGKNWEQGTLQNCTSGGSIEVIASDLVVGIGGFIGEVVGDITKCQSETKIITTIAPNRMGNFAGELLNANIIDCTISGDVKLKDWYDVGWQHYKNSKVQVSTY